jgi:hypothetical protein
MNCPPGWIAIARTACVSRSTRFAFLALGLRSNGRFASSDPLGDCDLASPLHTRDTESAYTAAASVGPTSQGACVRVRACVRARVFCAVSCGAVQCCEGQRCSARPSTTLLSVGGSSASAFTLSVFEELDGLIRRGGQQDRLARVERKIVDFEVVRRTASIVSKPRPRAWWRHAKRSQASERMRARRRAVGDELRRVRVGECNRWRPAGAAAADHWCGGQEFRVLRRWLRGLGGSGAKGMTACE